jgi:hypothetical protein
LKSFLDIDFIALRKARLLKYQNDKGGKDAVDSLLFALYERTEWKASRNSSRFKPGSGLRLMETYCDWISCYVKLHEGKMVTRAASFESAW